MKDEFLKLLSQLKNDWEINKEAKTAILGSSKFSFAVSFFMKALDSFMILANKFQVAGLFKKQVVMEVITDLYDYVVVPLIPAYIKIPFGGAIRTFVINVLVSQFIDFLVVKVRSVTPTPATPV